MTVATLRAETIAALLDLAWEQWSQLGVSGGTAESREERAADPKHCCCSRCTPAATTRGSSTRSSTGWPSTRHW